MTDAAPVNRQPISRYPLIAAMVGQTAKPLRS